MKTHLCSLVVAAATLVAVPASAQDVLTYAPDTVYFSAQGGANFGVIAVEPFEAGRPVTGAPYSAMAITEVTQTLADGNRIEHRSSAAIFRDSEGRVRREQQSLPLGPIVAPAGTPIVTISEPGGSHVMLDSERRVAVRTRMQTFDMPVPPPPGAGGRGMAANRVVMAAPQGETRTEKLEPRDVEGVLAEGTRTTMTIPAGSIGNQLPIEIVSERWYSPELQVVVMTRRSDPRFGETVYRLTNIVRAEPPAELFEVPPDYTVEEPRGPEMFRNRIVRPR
jgi:hypothetical protein